MTGFRPGYTLAKVSFEIVLAPEAIEDLRFLKANARANVRSALERHLRDEPEKTSRSRIKRLRGIARPQYRLRFLKANARANVRSALERHLRDEPEKTSRSRIKRLRGIARPQYRLRVGEVRVFYDVSGCTVEILAIVPKSEADLWLARYANPR